MNLPPGVTVSMIPGNRPIDRAWDAFWEEAEFYTLLSEWANENNEMLYHALLMMENDPDLNKRCADLVSGFNDELPVQTWFEDWMGGE